MKLRISLIVLILFCIVGLVPLSHQLIMGGIPENFAPEISNVKVVTELAKAYSLMLWLIITMGITCLAALVKDVLDDIQDKRIIS